MSGMMMHYDNKDQGQQQSDEKNQENSLPITVNVDVYVPGQSTFISIEVAEYLERIEKPVTVKFDDVINGKAIVSFERASTPTIPSRSLTIADLPEAEIRKGSTGFVYNRFEPDEGLSRADLSNNSGINRRTDGANSDFLSLAHAESKSLLDSRYTAPARYVNIDFSF